MPTHSKTPIAIGITGGSGAGKTTFAGRLHAALAPDAVVLAHDDYYKHLPGMTHEEARAHNFDEPAALDTYLLVEHLRLLKAGFPIEAPSYDFVAHARDDAGRHIEPVAYILVDGLMILADDALREMLDYVIFIDVDAETRMRRRIERDCNERGIDHAEALKMYRDFAEPAHELYVEPYKHVANIVISDAMDDRTLAAVVAELNELR